MSWTSPRAFRETARSRPGHGIVMNGQAITFDFHNTLASCPEWFELEVRRFRRRFFAGGQTGTAGICPAQPDEADARYRQLRREIIEHGNELTAEACLRTGFRRSAD